MEVPQFQFGQLPAIGRDPMNIGKDEPSVISYRQVTFMEVETEQQTPISPDDEQLVSAGFRVEAMKQRLPFVLPEGLA